MRCSLVTAVLETELENDVKQEIVEGEHSQNYLYDS